MILFKIAEADLKKILSSVGANVDEAALKTVCSALKGKALHEKNIKLI